MRREDWSSKLSAYIESVRGKDFVYGEHDCCLFVARCVDAMCDTFYEEKVLAKYKYDSEEKANEHINNDGGLIEMVTDFLGDPVPRAFAMPGDVVLLRDNGEAVLGIVEAHNAVAASKGGFISVPLKYAVVAWRIN